MKIAFHNSLKRLTALFSSVCLLMASTGIVWAQSNELGFDITAPSISHTAAPQNSIAGEAHNVVAEIRDNQSVESASISYRTSSDEFYSTISMAPDVTNTTWRASIETTPDDTFIYYFIVAEDSGGNRVQKGSESAPLKASLQTPPRLAAVIPAERNNQVKWLGIGLGVLAVVGLLASSGGGGGDDNNDSGITNSDDVNSPEECCTVTFTVPNVETN